MEYDSWQSQKEQRITSFKNLYNKIFACSYKTSGQEVNDMAAKKKAAAKKPAAKKPVKKKK